METALPVTAARPRKVHAAKPIEPKSRKSAAGKPPAKPSAQPIAKSKVEIDAPVKAPVRVKPASVTAAKTKRQPTVKKLGVAQPVDLPTKIQVAAYYLAEQRQFVPGYELEDWLVAERQVLASLSS
jgi:hypothetical protein